MKEVWKQISNHEGIYSASNLGRIRSDRFGANTFIGKILNPRINKKGYGFVLLSKKDKTRKNYLVATIIAETFIGPKPYNFQINHKDGIKLNNNVSNLEYVTHIENIKHSWKMGLHKPHKGVRGSKNNFAKLTEKQVLEIRKRYENGFKNFTHLSKEYKITGNCISSIIYRKTWKHI